MAGEHENLVRRMYEETWNEGRLDVIDEICATDYVGVGPYGNELGPESVKRGVTSRRDAFPGIHVTIEDVITEGDKVVGSPDVPGHAQGRVSGHSTHEQRGRVDRYLDISGCRREVHRALAKLRYARSDGATQRILD